LHTDEEYAKKTVFKGRIAAGPFTFALAVGLVFLSGIFGTSILAWLGVENMKIPLPVRPGDTLHVLATVLSKREAKKRDRGIIVFQYDIRNQNDETVMVFDYLLMMHRT
jgi:acyl dehydratase